MSHVDGASASVADPYQGLRDMISPVAHAYATLRRQREHAGTLLAETERLAATAELLLQHVGLLFVLDGPSPIGNEPHTVGKAGEIAAAFAAAQVAWADFVSGLEQLTREWIDRDDRPRVEELASCLAKLGEHQLADDLLKAALFHAGRIDWIEEWIKKHPEDAEAIKLLRTKIMKHAVTQAKLYEWPEYRGTCDGWFRDWVSDLAKVDPDGAEELRAYWMRVRRT